MATKRNITTLITFDQRRKPQNNGSCELQINLLSQTLKIFPKNQSYTDITAIFAWKFIRSKNILFVFAEGNNENSVQDFLLYFKNGESCNKVFNGIFKKRDVDSVEEESLNDRFLNPLFKYACKSFWMKEIIVEKWIQKFDEKEKNEYLQLLKWHQENPEIDDEEEHDIKDIKPKIELLQKSRKRRHHEIGSNLLSDSVKFDDQESSFNDLGDSDDENSEEYLTQNQDFSTDRQFTKNIEKSNYKIVRTGTRNRHILLLFTSSDKTLVYEYIFSPSKHFFHHRCSENLKPIKAYIDFNKNGEECIKMEDKEHECSPKLFEPENHFEVKILKKSDYEILENPGAKSKRLLIIFDLEDKNQCYEYGWNSSGKTYYCLGCFSKRRARIATAIYDENLEYILFSPDQHVCNKRKYNPEKYLSVNQFVNSPNFKIQTKIKNGIERKTLIIFNGNNREFCYTYHLNNATKVFDCNNCRRQNKIVSAKVYKNDENEEYVILSNGKHVCTPRNFNPETILRPPKFKFIEASEEFTSKLFIFDSTDPKLCYTFSQLGGEKRYYCSGCKGVAQRNKKDPNCDQTTNKGVVVFLDNEPNGEYFVRINNSRRHICQPQKYNPGKYEIKILKINIDYILIREKKRSGDRIFLIRYHSNDRNLCFKYSYGEWKNVFQCFACAEKGSFVSAKLHQDADGIEYIAASQEKHICTPIKYSRVVKPDTVILDKTDLIFVKPKKKEIDENRIVQLPKFQLQRNTYNVPERRLIVFFDEARKLCYDYVYGNSKFRCKKCNITAKIEIDEENDNEKFVILSKNEHKCEPVKYEPEKKMIELNENGTSNFMVFNRDDETKPIKLIIFTSSTKEMCYEYSYCKPSKIFRCCGCITLKKINSAKLLSDDDGKDYVKLLKTEHVCSPKKFILEEFQPKIISENGFKLCSNKNGKPNSKLFLFDSEKEGFAFEYYLAKNNYFICLQCSSKKTTVSAKLFEKENGEKYLELSSMKHVCKSKPEKTQTTKTQITSNFVVHFNDSGERDSRLTLLNVDDKSLGFRYSFDKRNNVFCCLGCKSKKKNSSAKLITDKDGNQSLQFGKNEHVFIIQNLKKKKLYFSDFKFEENGNILITNDQTQKNQFFKFEYDEKVGTFCCSKCLEKKKKYITATICKENDGKEFVLLNVPHRCIPFSK